jgi:transposase
MVHTMKRVQSEVARLQKAVRRRRMHDAAFKRQLIELTLAPRASVAQIALDHRLNANLLFKWRREHLRSLGRSLAGPAAAMLPVTVIESEDTAQKLPAQTLSLMSERKAHASSSTAGSIEIDLPLGRVRLKGGVDREALRVVVDVLSRR